MTGKRPKRTLRKPAPPGPWLRDGRCLGRVIAVDQSLLGRTPRSNPAVYIGAFEDIRAFFAQSDAARQRGLAASAFSFNSPQGQCERCRGAGFEKIEMQFLSDVFVRCPDCNGRRYRPHILEVTVAGRAKSGAARTWSIADILDASVDDVIDFLGGFTDSRPAARAVASLKLSAGSRPRLFARWPAGQHAFRLPFYLPCNRRDSQNAN